VVEIFVSSRHVDVSPALRAAVIEKIGNLERYLEDMDRAEAHFSAERNPRIGDRELCEVTITGHGHVVRAKVAAADQFAAVDAAVAKLEQQLHKLKTRLVSRSKGKRHPSSRAVAATAERDADAELARGESGVESEDGRLVKVKRFAMKPMTVEEAILQMDLLGHSFFFFENAETESTAVLYRRSDGDLGMIEAAP
jgi:putative sigma-54 modulation protein